MNCISTASKSSSSVSFVTHSKTINIPATPSSSLSAVVVSTVAKKNNPNLIDYLSHEEEGVNCEISSNSKSTREDISEEVIDSNLNKCQIRNNNSSTVYSVFHKTNSANIKMNEISMAANVNLNQNESSSIGIFIFSLLLDTTTRLEISVPCRDANS